MSATRENQLTPWNINDAKACVVYKRLGEIITIDGQLFSIVKDPTCEMP